MIVPPDLMMRLLSRREWVLMFIATFFMSAFLGFLLLVPVATWVLFIICVLGLVFFGFKAFVQKAGENAPGMESTLKSVDLAGLMGVSVGKGKKAKSVRK